MAGNQTQCLCKSDGVCELCNCTGRACPNLYRGLKVQWPELKGTSAVSAKGIIERDNPNVTAWIFPNTYVFPAVMCCRRVLLITPEDDCPNGPVLNDPFVG